MSFIDWSDSEAMLGLLVEWVADERSAAGDSPRADFLAGLSGELAALADNFDALPPDELVARLRAIHEERCAEHPGDPALGHVADCIEEMQGLRDEP